jgi:hypothetical protein
LEGNTYYTILCDSNILLQIKLWIVWFSPVNKEIVIEATPTGMTKGRVTNRRVISESYDFGELCSNHARTTPTFPNDHTQFLNSSDVSLN